MPHAHTAVGIRVKESYSRAPFLKDSTVHCTVVYYVCNNLGA